MNTKTNKMKLVAIAIMVSVTIVNVYIYFMKGNEGIKRHYSGSEVYQEEAPFFQILMFPTNESYFHAKEDLTDEGKIKLEEQTIVFSNQLHDMVAVKRIEGRMMYLDVNTLTVLPDDRNINILKSDYWKWERKEIRNGLYVIDFVYYDDDHARKTTNIYKTDGTKILKLDLTTKAAIGTLIAIQMFLKMEILIILVVIAIYYLTLKLNKCKSSRET